MKKNHNTIVASLVILSLLQTTAHAQQEKPWQVRRAYLSATAGTASGFALTTHFNNRWIAMISMQDVSQTAKNLPDAFVPYTGTFLGYTYTNNGPEDNYQSYTLSAGRVLNKPSDKAWVMATAGLSYCKYSINEFKYSQSPDYTTDFSVYRRLDGNYVYKVEDKNGVGATIGAQATVNLFRFMGLEAGGNVLVSTGAIIPSAWLGINVGLMRPAKTKPAQL